MDTEDQDFEEEKVVDPNLELFLRQARREELAELIRRMNSKLQKFSRELMSMADKSLSSAK